MVGSCGLALEVPGQGLAAKEIEEIAEAIVEKRLYGDDYLKSIQKMQERSLEEEDFQECQEPGFSTEGRMTDICDDAEPQRLWVLEGRGGN